MKIFLIVFGILITCAVSGQPLGIPTVNSRHLDYLIVNKEMNSITCATGNYGDSGYLIYDSTYYFAHIIFPDLPLVFNEDSLALRTKEVMIAENIQTAYIWRDTESLWMLPFSRRTEEMREHYEMSFIGWIRNMNEEVQFDQK